MTTRDHARRAAPSASAPASAATPAIPARACPTGCAAARERKGVDLVRAERDTKIRVRYLSALERGDYRDLPGAVYTKGFLRNYAIYLGLDPEDVLRQWRRERGEPGRRPSRSSCRRGRSTSRSRPLNFSPSVVVAALLTAGVVLFFIYLGVAAAALLAPAGARGHATRRRRSSRSSETTTTFRLAGTTTPGSIIDDRGAPARTEPIRVTALANGEWILQVDLRRGQNRFDIKAVNPETGRNPRRRARS